MHGYQIIQVISERSGGNWTPSPGSVYPTLQQLEDEGLIEPAASESGRRVFALTEAGARKREHRRRRSRTLGGGGRRGRRRPRRAPRPRPPGARRDAAGRPGGHGRRRSRAPRTCCARPARASTGSSPRTSNGRDSSGPDRLSLAPARPGGAVRLAASSLVMRRAAPRLIPAAPEDLLSEADAESHRGPMAAAAPPIHAAPCPAPSTSRQGAPS